LANDQWVRSVLKGGELGSSLGAQAEPDAADHVVRQSRGATRCNVTIATNAAAAEPGRTRICGVRPTRIPRIGPDWRVAGAYLNNHATVTEFDRNPVLVGKYLPQVPKNRGSVTVAYNNVKYVTVAVSALFYGRQFNEDLNNGVTPGETEPGLPAYATMEMSAVRGIGHNVDVFFGIQNMFDEYIVQLLPTTTGSPCLVNGGLRVRWSGR
jgi:outer membrane receptor for monomeric catechols